MSSIYLSESLNVYDLTCILRKWMHRENAIQEEGARPEVVSAQYAAAGVALGSVSQLRRSASRRREGYRRAAALAATANRMTIYHTR